MSAYNFLFVWVAIFAILQRSIEMKKPIMVMGRVRIRWMIPFAVVVFFPIFWLAARGTPIGDIPGYILGYHSAANSWAELSSIVKGHHSGFTFDFLEGLIFILSGGSEKAFRIVIGLIQCIPIVFLFRTYSEDYLTSVFLFIATASHIAWLMNGMRQFVAVAIIYTSTPLMLRKRYIPTILLILLAVTVHTSAIIMLPIIFVVTGKAWNRRTMLFIILTVAAVYMFTRNATWGDELLVGTEYANTFSYYQKVGDDGVNPIRVLVSFVPVFLSLLGRRAVAADGDPVANLCINMSIVTASLYLIGMVTNGIMVGRLPGYTFLYSLILLPYLVRRIFTKDSALFVNIIMIGAYMMYYYYSVGF